MLYNRINERSFICPLLFRGTIMNTMRNYSYHIFSSDYSLPLNEKVAGTREQILLMATIAFAKHGYASVSMRDIAKALGCQPSSIYNYFESKEGLWKEVVDHAASLYRLYFSHVNGSITAAVSFEEVLEAIFHEPKRLANAFTCYAFTMVQTEQFHDRHAGMAFEESFLCYGVDFLDDWFGKCVDRAMVPPFDTRTVAVIVMHSIFMGLPVEMHRQLGNPFPVPYEPRKMFADLQRFILGAVGAGRRGDTLPEKCPGPESP